MNVHISKDDLKKFCLYNSPNGNSEFLADFSPEKRLACLNIEFQKMEGKLWTYNSINNSKSLLDYTFINKKWINSVNTYES